jgi:regulator of replication initiation timing
MRRNMIASVVLTLALGIAMIGCEDTKARQENEQLKARVAELEKQKEDLQKNVDGLTKDNATLAQENQQLKAKISQARKSSKAKHHKRTAKPASSTN